MAPEIDMDLLWMVTAVFAGLAACYLILIFTARNRSRSRMRDMRSRKQALAPMISRFLFFNQETDVEQREEYIRMKIEIRELLKDPLDREVITEVLMDLRLDVAGEAGEVLLKLYQDLGLETDAYAMLRSWRWERISRGLVFLTEMHVESAYPFITRFINDRRSVIRKQAQLAAVSLREEGLAYFMDTARYGISEWQQLKLLEILRHREVYDPPRFSNWLLSENKDVVLFALRLIRHYNQTDAEAAIIRLLRHRNPGVKIAAVDCIREFRFASASDALKSAFLRASEPVRLHIIDALAVLGNPGDFNFIEKHSRQDTSFVIRAKAKAALNQLVPGSVLPSADLEDAEPDSNVLQEATDIGDLPNPAAPLQTETGSEAKEETASGEAEIPAISLPAADYAAIAIPEEHNLPEAESAPTAPWFRPEEDEALFDICFLQELSDILTGNSLSEDREAQAERAAFVPLVRAEPLGNVSHMSWLRDIGVTDAEWITGSDPELPPGKEEPEPASDPDFAAASAIAKVRTEPEPEVDPDFGIEGTPWSGVLPATDPAPEAAGCFSIVREMFRERDTESRLILLDTLPAVAERKELEFLRTLQQDPEPRVAFKSRQIVRTIERKLEAAGDMHTASAEETRKADPAPERGAVSAPLLFEPHFDGEAGGPLPTDRITENPKTEGNE